jgi:hypothetical protein
MTHPHFTSALLPLGARSLAFRSNSARVVDVRKTNPLAMHFESAVAVHACCDMDMPTRRSERHPRKILTDPNNEIAMEFTLL